MTLAQLVAEIRTLIGDDYRISGTVTAGSVSYLTDTALLSQADDHWKGLYAIILTSTDALAPQGEERKIEKSSNVARRVTFELPLSAAVEEGDTYALAVVSESKIKAAINKAIGIFSNYFVYKTTKTLTVNTTDREYSIPGNNGSILAVVKLRYAVTDETEDRYQDRWYWDEYSQKIVFDSKFSEVRTLEVSIKCSHPTLADNADELTIPAKQLQLFKSLVVVEVLELLSNEELSNYFRDDKSAVKTIKRGEVTITKADFQQWVSKSRSDIMQQLQSIALNEPSIGTLPSGRRSTRTGLAGAAPAVRNLIDTSKLDSDGWYPPLFLVQK